MTKVQMKKVRKRLNDYTELVVFDCADNGHGYDHKRANAALERLLEMLERLVDTEFKAVQAFQRVSDRVIRGPG